MKSVNYKKLTQREHVLVRPGVYIGSVEMETSSEYVYRDGGIVREEIAFIPALHKLYDEVLSNASDNYARGGGTKKIKIKLKPGSISVWNDGESIPIDTTMMGGKTPVITSIFGQLLTGSNFDDSKERATAGVNGMGVKLCNIWSSKFTVTVINGGRRFKQTWSKNMSNCGKPRIADAKGEVDSVCVEFTPDFKRFNIEGFSESDMELMSKRALDLVLCFGLDIRVNGRRHFKKPLDYLKSMNKGIVTQSDATWTVAVMPNRDKEAGLVQLSFVNGVHTRDGGTHVNHVVSKISKLLSTALSSKLKLRPTPKLIKDNLTVVVACRVDKPLFSSQSKTQLVSKSSKFKTWLGSEKFRKALLKSSIYSELVDIFSNKMDNDMARQDGKKTSRCRVPKLIDAKFAGTTKSEDCVLVLAEGDSALSMLLKGVTANGLQKTIGLFPLRGKLLNCSGVSKSKLLANAEIQNLKTIIGLSNGKTYSNTKGLRYGRVIVAADADEDGQHILGLVLTMFRSLYPNLVQMGYVKTFTTPLLMARKGSKLLEFFTVSDFKQWKCKTTNWNSYAVKFYKGLGSSTNADAKRYFKNLKHYVRVLKDPKAGLGSLAMVFSKHSDALAARKVYVSKPRHSGFDKDTLEGFVRGPLHKYARSSLIRAIPSIDGFKESTRKIMWTCLKKGLYGEKKNIKVSELAGLVSKFAKYHHGETSLQGAIVTLARRYTTVNNQPLLVDSGQFGSYISGGADSASARYLFTYLEDICQYMFNQSDFNVLPRTLVDGEQAEPKLLAPLLPIAPLNGTAGIATGFSTNIYPHSAKDLIAATLCILKGKSVPTIIPSFRDWKGAISCHDGGFISRGTCTKLSKVQIRVHSLPIGVCPNAFEKTLSKLKDKHKIKTFDVQHFENGPQFLISFTDAECCRELQDKLLVRGHSTNNMHLLNKMGELKRYSNIRDILEEYVEFKLQITRMRLRFEIETLRTTLLSVQAIQTFIELFLNGDIEFKGKSDQELNNTLHRYSLRPHAPMLLALPIRRLTQSEIRKSARTQLQLRAQLTALEGTNANKTYIKELNALKKAISTSTKRKRIDSQCENRIIKKK